jgi:hypothetical protein
MSVITLLSEQFKYRYKSIGRKLRGILVGDAVAILNQIFQVAEVDIRFGGKKMALNELLEANPGFATWEANRIVIDFFGGPPGMYGFYRGTIKTYLCDQLNWAVTHSDDRKINRFLAYHLHS